MDYIAILLLTMARFHISNASKFICVLLSIFAVGCASYKPKDFKSLVYEQEATLCTPKSPKNKYNAAVQVYALKLSSAKTKAYFDRDICSQGYIAIQFTIVNDSDEAFVLSNSNIGMSVANPNQIAELVHTSTAGRAGTYGAGALIFLPLAIPAVVDGMKSSEANKQLDADFSARCAEVCYIPAHSMRNHAIFVQNSSFSNSFEMFLVGQEDRTLKLNYNVNL